MNDDRRVFKIKLRIGDRPFPVDIDPAEEQAIRNAADKVSELYAIYMDRYKESDLSNQDLMAMVAFRFAYMAEKLIQSRDIDLLNHEIEEMTKDLDNYLSNRR